MARSVKLEDYWKQHNIEGIFKDLTHMLVQKMSADPVLAIVQHLQRKYPKSFKTSLDQNDSATSFSKTVANNLQSQSILSHTSDMDVANRSDTNLGRRASVQSQVSGIVTIPSLGSAFTGLLKFDRSDSQAQSGLVLKNLAMIDRIGQHAVRMGKDLRSDHDILEEELIPPTRTKAERPLIDDPMTPSQLDDSDQPSTDEQPTALQLIKYKQHIRTEQGRQLHRKGLAELAEKRRIEEEILHTPAAPEDSDEVSKRMRRSRADHKHHHHGDHFEADKEKAEALRKVPVGAEEEEVLNEELHFNSRIPREKERGKRKTSLSRSHSPNVYAQYLMNTSRSLPMMQFFVCKVCGNVMNSSDKIERHEAPVQHASNYRQESIAASEGTVDDWFDSASTVGDSPNAQSVILQDPMTPSPSDSISSPKNRFQPISESRTPVNAGRPPIIPLIVTDDDARSRNRTPRLSGSDIFVRTPEPIASRRPSAHGMGTPPVESSRPDSRNVATASPPVKDSFSPIFSGKRTDSPLTYTMDRSITRRMSGWSVHEQSPDETDGHNS